MANWDDFLDSSLEPKPGLVLITYGDNSALVWDKVASLGRQGYSYRVDVTSPVDVAYSIPSDHGTMYVLKDPNSKTLDATGVALRSGSLDTYILVFTKDTMPKHREIDYLKRKTQVHKAYFNLNAPRSEKARDWMTTFFSLRWGVTREQGEVVCTMLDFNPGNLYLFDKQYRYAGGDDTLSSTRAKALIESILGSSSGTLVPLRILMKMQVEGKFDSSMNWSTMNYLSNLVEDASTVQVSMSRANTTVPMIAKDSGLSHFQVLNSMSTAMNYSRSELDSCRALLRIMYQYHEEPESMEVLSRVWKAV